MGFVTNQWIKDLGRLRESEHVPIEASIAVVEDCDDWSAENGIVLEIQATRQNGDYQSIYLAISELDSVVRAVVRVGNRATRKRLAMDFLINATDADFVKLVTKTLEHRLVDKAKRAAHG